MLLTGIVFVPPVEASAATNTVEPQIRIRLGGGRRYRRNNRVRYTTTYRITGWGRNRYRETIRTTYWPNGRRTVQVIRRQRIGGYRG